MRRFKVCLCGTTLTSGRGDVRMKMRKAMITAISEVVCGEAPYERSRLITFLVERVRMMLNSHQF